MDVLCYGLQYVVVFIYADDIVLLCPSLRCLRSMVACPVDFAARLHLAFNSTKSFAKCFGSSTLNTMINVNTKSVCKLTVWEIMSSLACDFSE